MTKIYLIRHAEAEGNLYRRAQGSWNSSLTDTGLKQVDALYERFKDTPLDAVYASDLKRARQTAEALVRGRDMEIRTEPRIRELNMGSWEGRPWGELEHRWPDEMKMFYRDPAKWLVPGGERFEDVQARMLAAIREMARRHEGGTVAALSHGMAIRCFLYAAFSLPSDDPEFSKKHADNTAVTTLEIEDDAIRVTGLFDNTHVPKELATFARQKWWKNPGSFDSTCFYYEPLDPKKRSEAETYLRCYADAWRAAHGSEDGFEPTAYLSTARSHSSYDGNCLVRVMSGDELAGMIELDPKRGKEDGIGWVSLLCLTPEQRGRGLGVQLLGYVMYYFQEKGRSAIRLHAAVTNEHAVAFYKKYGFETLRIDPGVSSDQYLMEKKI